MLRRVAWLLAAFLLLVAVVLAVQRFFEGPRVSLETDRPPASFPGASSRRLFLSPAEREAAHAEGLAPADSGSIVSTGKSLDYGEWRWDDAGIPDGPVTIWINLRRQLISVYRGPHEIGTAVIAYGGDKPSPTGRMPILGKTKDYHSKTYDAPMPYSLWIRDDGIAIHGSPIAGDHATNGCVGVPVDFAAKLFAVAEKGDWVEIRG